MTTPDQAFTGWVQYGAGGGGGNAFVQGGNAFGVTAVLGTTDGQDLDVTAPTINLVAPTELQVNGAAGAAGQVLTSQGAGLPPVWAAGGGGGPWTLVETKTLAAAATSTFAGLNGDSDKIYWVEGELTLSAGSQVALYPNGNSGAVCAGSYLAINSSGAPPASAALSQILYPASTTLTGVSRVAFWCRIDAESRAATLQQLFQWQSITRFQGPISFQTLIENGGNSFNVSPIANLTSLQVAAVAGTLTGQVSLYKLSRT